MSTATKSASQDTTRESVNGYEQVHAAIQELFRLMGVPYSESAGFEVPGGYGVFNYPTPGLQAMPPGMPPATDPALPPSPTPGWMNAPNPYVASPYFSSPPFVMNQYSGFPATFPVWQPYFNPGPVR